MTKQVSLVYRKRGRRILYLLVVIGVILYLTFGRFGIVSIMRMKRKEKQLKARASELEAKKIILEEEIKKILSDKKEIERLARKKLSMVKRGEKIIIIKEVK